ncbi:uncharacterized protein LOC142817339 [Rhipicephalus microplus]|uniref:uncharacterized protein LOC142817339 n=1 Tax=Rhipicephalus microplus TaxID=6941 RepID=UPI003F6C7A18
MFNYTASCKTPTRTLEADLGNDTENPYMDIKNWTEGHNLKKYFMHYYFNESCALFWYRENGRGHYEVHIRADKFAIKEGKEVFSSCLSLYKSYTSQLTGPTLACTYDC